MKTILRYITTIMIFMALFATVGMYAAIKASVVIFGIMFVTHSTVIGVQTLAIVGGIIGAVSEFFNVGREGRRLTD